MARLPPLLIMEPMTLFGGMGRITALLDLSRMRSFQHLLDLTHPPLIITTLLHLKQWRLPGRLAA
eukprot:9123722-Prorocentrum_lima.AAC.1